MTPCWCQRKKVRSFCWCLASLPCARCWSDEPYLLAAPRLARPRNDADWRTMRPASARSQDVGQRHRGGVGDRPARCLGEIRRWLHAGQLRRFDQRGEECRPARPALRASLVMILAPIPSSAWPQSCCVVPLRHLLVAFYFTSLIVPVPQSGHDVVAPNWP